MREKTKAADSPAPSRIPAARYAAAKPEARARISNGRQMFLERLDGRSREARRWRDLFCGFMDQTQGRNETLVRALASLCLQRDLIEVRMARGEAVETGDLIRVCGAISRLMTKLDLVAGEPVEDGTPQAIANLRAQFEAAP